MIAEEREALQRPVEDSERRIEALNETVAGAERSMRELGFLLIAEQRHLSDTFVDGHRAFLASALPQANREFQAALESAEPRMGPAYRRWLMREAQEIARRLVLPWLRAEQQNAEEEYQRVTRRFVDLGNDFLRKLAATGLPELARMPHALDRETGFRIRSKFSFLDLIEIAQPASPLRWLADVFLGLVGARRPIASDAREFLVRLLETNSTRVQSDILNRVQESRTRLEVEILKLLHEVSRIAQEALSRARTAHAVGTAAVQAELERLDRLEKRTRECAPASTQPLLK
jgi:hypothetical protein